MSRLRGIEVKVQKEILQTRKYGLNEILKKKKEDQTSNSKDDVEKQQINELCLKLPKLDKIFEVHRKIGEGTFSSVYLGSLRQHAALSSAEKRWFAIKHLVPTAHPARIEHELRCLQDMGGKDHVIGVELCLRHLDTIVFIMPYLPHKKFSEYVGSMDASELRRYLRALLVALRHVHSFGVIHRDVKPSNFLYDRDNQRYLLVDFGLAQRICPAPEEAPAAAAAAPTVPAPPPAHAHNVRKRPREEDDWPAGAKRAALDLSMRAGPGPGPRPGPGQAPGRRDSSARPSATPIIVPKSPAVSPPVAAGAGVARSRCTCGGVGGVCGWCGSLGAARAPRAGTQGFRPPEVLLKYPRQTTAVDVWAAGIVTATILTARYPLLRASDDASALAELAVLLGTAPLQQAARALGRRIVTSSFRRGLCLRKLSARLRGPAAPGAAPAPPPPACVRCRLPLCQCLCRDDTKKAEEFSAGVWVAGFPDCAFALCARMLDPNPHTRISAHEALHHPFLTDPDPDPDT